MTEPAAIPAAVPIGLPQPAVAGGLRPVNPLPEKGFAATKDSSKGVTGRRHSERRRGRGAAGLTELARLLSKRDMAVLDVIAQHRFLSTAQVQTFLFHDHASSESAGRCCRRVLHRLEDWQLVERPIRRVGGLYAGSASSVWLLSSMGQRLRNLRAGLGAVGRVREPGERFIQHYLAIADAHLALREAARAGRLELLTVQIEPACWRPYNGLGGSRESSSLTYTR